MLLLSLELMHSQFLINQYSVFQSQFKLHFTFRFQLQDKQFFRTIQCFLLSYIDKRRIERFHSIGMQAVVSQVFHCFHIQRLYTNELKVILIVRQCKAKCIHSFQVITLHADFKDFPPIRVWGTIGFICAMWAVDLTGFKNSSAQLYVGAISALLLGVYSFTLPACKPAKTENKSLLSAFGLDALVLFKRKKMAIFFLFSMLLGAALQITNTYGDLFLGSFAGIPEFADSFGVKHSVILLSISQMSETLFILAIPFFLKHFGIKQVMLISMFAWVFRFGLFGFGDPGGGLWMLILSMIVYGMAFDFFNISGSLFVEQETNSSIRASAQGLFFMMTNGLGAIIGGYASGAVVDAFSVYADGKLVSREWTDIWLIFAAYALVIGILFALVFKYKHRRESKTN